MTNLPSAIAHRERVAAVQAKIRSMPGALVGEDTEQVCPVKHSFGDGCYVREWSCPAGVLTVSKIHKVGHPFFVLKGEVSVLTENGVERILAPHYGITPVGTQRVLFTHTDTKWVTVHVTSETDVAKIEEEIIAKDFSDPAITEADLARLMEIGE